MVHLLIKKIQKREDACRKKEGEDYTSFIIEKQERTKPVPFILSDTI